MVDIVIFLLPIFPQYIIYSHILLCNGRNITLIGRALCSVSNVNNSRKIPAKLSLESWWWARTAKPRPWNTSLLKVSAPNSRSTFPGVPNSGSASCKPSRSFQLEPTETACRRRLDVIFDSISASTSKYYLSLIIWTNDTKICYPAWWWLVWSRTDTANFHTMVMTR